MALVGVTGYATSGKDEVANVLVREFGFERTSWADPLRRDIATLDPMVGFLRKWWGGRRWYTYTEAVEAFGYTEAKVLFPEMRRLLQVYGTEVHRTLDPDYWVKRTRQALRPGHNYVIPDVRYANEARAVDFLIHVDRPGVGPLNDHVSESGEAFPFADARISNSGDLSDLRNAVINVMLRIDKPGIRGIRHLPVIDGRAD